MKHLSWMMVLALAACGGSGDSPDAAPIDSAPPLGTFTMAWSLTDGSGALTCEDVAGLTVRVTGVPIQGVTGFSEVFTCGSGSGTSGGIAPGTYNLSVDLTTTGGASLLTAKVPLSNVTFTSGGNTQVDDVSFQVLRRGDFSFRLDAQGDGTNCGDPAAGGGGIVGIQLQLLDGSDTCVDGVDLVVAAGGGASGTYTTNCAAPPVFGCIETDQDISATAIVSGPHKIQVTGQKAGPIDCYSRTSTFTVPGNDLAVALGDLPLALTASVECDPSLLPDAGL